MGYCSWADALQLTRIRSDGNGGVSQVPLCIEPERENHFAAFSVSLSADASEVVCGTSEHAVYTYDVTAERRVGRIVAHSADVNSVAYDSCHATPRCVYSAGG